MHVLCCATRVCVCVSWFKFLCQVLSRDLAATLSTLAGELSRSDSEDTLEEQAAVLLELPRKRAVLREAAESSIAGSRPSRCPARLFAPFAFQQTSNKCCRRPRSLHCDSTLWKRRGGAFRPQGPTMARCHIPSGCWCHYWGVASFHLSEKDIMVFPRPRLSQCVPAHGPEVVLKHDYQQRSASSEHSCGHRQGSCHFCSLQPAAWHQSAIRILRAPDPDATKFGPGSTERRGPSVPRQSVSQETRQRFSMTCCDAR